MRISDWISDVCSSYLFQDPPLGLRPAGLHRVLGRLVDANPHVNPPLPVHAARVGTARRRFGRGGRIRTAGPLLPKQMRYQTALHPETLQSRGIPSLRSEEHTSELQSLMRTSYAVFCLKKKINIS